MAVWVDVDLTYEAAAHAVAMPSDDDDSDGDDPASFIVPGYGPRCARQTLR